MTLAEKLAAGAIGAALLVGGVGTSTLLTSEQSVPAGTMNCEDWSVQLTQGECFAAGAIRNVALSNLQGAAQFCIWRKANPGEWSRLKSYAETENPPEQIVTWFGSGLRNLLEAYFATGAPTFTIVPNTAPNICRTPLPAPVVSGVTPGQTDVTVTIAP
jgi:hypothetical protein